MNKPLKTFLGFSWVGWLNIVVLQWFCIRLSYVVLDGVVIKYKKLDGIVLPLTGWWSEYIYLYKK